MTSAPQNIILLGDPAAGKSTQAQRIVKRYRLHDFDMGFELRKLERDPRIHARYKLRDELRRGNLAPTALARRIIADTLRAVPVSRGILFAGHPKMLGEAKYLDRELRKRKRQDPVVIYLRVPAREMYARARKRGRSDDTLAAVQNRLRYYEKNIRPALAFYRSRYTFRQISGLGTRDEVFRRIRAFIDRATKRNANAYAP
ncbi:MAG: hypothetical protein RL681_508 [Candidatus Parcubacteria bacterium]|jgi:adenylate kinase